MEFVTSDGRVISEHRLYWEFNLILGELKRYGETPISPWQKEFFEWFLNKKINYQLNVHQNYFIRSHENITEDELKQLEQLIDYLEL